MRHVLWLMCNRPHVRICRHSSPIGGPIEGVRFSCGPAKDADPDRIDSWHPTRLSPMPILRYAGRPSAYPEATNLLRIASAITRCPLPFGWNEFCHL
jgi:hypothetical protein